MIYSHCRKLFCNSKTYTDLGSHSAVSSLRSSGAALSHTPEHGLSRVLEPSSPHDVEHGVHSSQGPVEHA